MTLLLAVALAPAAAPHSVSGSLPNGTMSILIAAPDTIQRSVGDDLSAGWEAFKHVLSSPVRWESEDWMILGVTGGITVGSVFVEEAVREAMLGARGRLADALERVGWWYGSYRFTIPFSLATYGAGALFNADGVRDTGLMMSELLLTVLLVQQPLRIAFGRARPAIGKGHGHFEPFTLGNDYASFISGHAWQAFGISNVIARQADRWWASIGLYTLAGLTSLSRVYGDRHWLSDVIMGSALGYFISTSLWQWHQDRAAPAPAVRRKPAPVWLTVSLSI